MSNQYLAKQFSGPLAQNTINTVLAQYQKSNPMLSYWHNLSIDTAADDELTAIGYLIGFPWPTAPSGTLDSNSFIFGSSLSYPESSLVGLSGVGLLSGGILSSSGAAANNKVPASVYRLLLKAIAKAKWNGLSWATIDAIASSFGNLNYVYRNSSYNQFFLGSSATYPTTDATHGLSGVGITTGGRLQSTNPDHYPDSDITIAFITPLSSANLWIIKEIFTSICTSPQVFVQNGA